MVNTVAREEGFNVPKLVQNVILLLLYAYDVVLLAYDVDSMQHLLGVLEEFCQSSGPSSGCGENKKDGSANHPTSSLPYTHI